MNMIRNLILVASALALVGQSMAASVPEDGSLIKHPAPTEQLDREQLIAKLSAEDSYEINQGRVAEYVAEQLYAAKDKATTEVFEEMTVQDLIDMNHVDLSRCSAKSLNDRKFGLLFQVDHKDRPLEVVYGLVVYMMQADLLSFVYCAKNREQVVSQGIATMAELKKFFESQGLSYPPKEGAAEDEFGDVPDFTPEMMESSGIKKAMDIQASYTGALINHPPKSRKLDKDQLIERLSLPNLRTEQRGRVAEYVAEQLYSAKDKATTEVLEGVTVSSLIELNTVGLTRCSKEAMGMMEEELEKLFNVQLNGEKYELVYGIFVFAFQAEVMVNEYCMAHRDEVLESGYADARQMNTFLERMKSDRARDVLDEDDDFEDDDDYFNYFEANYEMGSLVSATTEELEDSMAANMPSVFHSRD